MGVAFHGIRKEFPDGTVALNRLDLAFDSGEFLVLLGPSGSGKSTACRILAGLETPSAGRIEVRGEDITSRPPRDRGMSMVFQNYALYPHKTVYENIAYPLRVRKVSRGERDRAVREVADMLRLGKLLDRRPRQLSGGEAQRVAVARALVWQPDICLMDEPLSNLDARLRLHMRAELKRIHQSLQKTFVFVTHDQEEAMSLGTRIAVLHRGRLIQFATPQEIYHQPATRFVAEFIGRPAMNTIEGVIEGGVFRAGDLAVPLGGEGGGGDESGGGGPGSGSSGERARRPGDGGERARRPGDDGGEHARRPGDGPVVLGIRPEAVELRDEPGPDTLTLSLDVMEVVEPDTLLSLRRGPVSLVVRVMRPIARHAPGADIHVTLPRQALHFFDSDTGARRA